MYTYTCMYPFSGNEPTFRQGLGALGPLVGATEDDNT